jgi:hypothetical protein
MKNSIIGILLIFSQCRVTQINESQILLNTVNSDSLNIKIDSFVKIVKHSNQLIDILGLDKGLKNGIYAKQLLLVSNTMYMYGDSILFNLVDNKQESINIIKEYNSKIRIGDFYDKLRKYYRYKEGPGMLYFTKFNIYIPPNYNNCSRYYLKDYLPPK